jgi:hypothetical protein
MQENIDNELYVLAISYLEDARDAKRELEATVIAFLCR